MEVHFTLRRGLVFILLLAGFCLLGGFQAPESMPRPSMRAWGVSVILFSFGAFAATLVNHWIGNLDRSNLRWLWVVLGMLCMGTGLGYQKMLRDRFADEPRIES